MRVMIETSDCKDCADGDTSLSAILVIQRLV